MDATELNGAIAAEKRLLDPAVRRDSEAVSALLDDDFTEIGQTGVSWTRAGILEALAAEPADRAVVETSAWTVRQVAPELALVGYETRQGGIRARRTTLWRWRAGSWRAVAHQATRLG